MADKKSKGQKATEETREKAEDIAAEAEDALEEQAEDLPTGERSHPPA